MINEPYETPDAPQVQFVRRIVGAMTPPSIIDVIMGPYGSVNDITVTEKKNSDFFVPWQNDGNGN